MPTAAASSSCRSTHSEARTLERRSETCFPPRFADGAGSPPAPPPSGAVASSDHPLVTVLAEAPPDAWGGRAAADWAARLAAGARFDPEAWRLVEVARVLDRIYGR